MCCTNMTYVKTLTKKRVNAWYRAETSFKFKSLYTRNSMGLATWVLGTTLTCNVCFGLGLLNSKMDEMNAPNLKNNPFLCFISFNIFNCLYTSFFLKVIYRVIWLKGRWKTYFENLTHHIFFDHILIKMSSFFVVKVITFFFLKKKLTRKYLQ